jgi:magnesium transporter
MTPPIQTPGPDRDAALTNLVIAAELGQDERVQAGITSLHPADIAELLDVLEEAETKNRVFGFLPPDLASEVLSFATPPTRSILAQDLSDATLGGVIEHIESDDAADLLESLSPRRAYAVLSQVPQDVAAEMAQLLRYPADVAGGIMQTEYVAVPEGARVEQAIEVIRSNVDEVSDLHSVFIINQVSHLVGVLPLRKLILARTTDLVEQIMDRQVISVRVDLDQEEVAQVCKKYDLVSLPVVDAQGKLVGLIMVDDVVDVLEEEATEDIYKLANLSQEEEVFESPWRSIRHRLPWLGLNLATTTLSASVITFFEDTIQALAVAAAFMTIVAAQGGNAGIQTLTVIVRGLALGEVSLKHAKRVLFKELRIALGNGLILGCIAGSIAYLWEGNPLLGGVLALALVVNLVVAAFVGSMVPFTLSRLGIDPAVASNVFVTACTDICGFFSFLGILTLFWRFF